MRINLYFLENKDAYGRLKGRFGLVIKPLFMLDDAATVVALILAASTLHTGRNFFFLDFYFLVRGQVQPYCVLTVAICLRWTSSNLSHNFLGR